MSSRLYYTEPARLEFDATVVVVSREDTRWRVHLDRTAFYPTSGGQPHDTGLLGDVPVIDVQEEDDGGVAHVTERPLEAGTRIHGVIERGRRIDHMQQHSGQHVLSAAFARLLDVRTESFHLGATASTIDLGREVRPEEIARAEDEANRVVWENRPVTIRFVSAQEADRLPLRKEPVRGGTLRLIDIADFDLSACGGTHVARTGEIGTILVRRWERLRGGSRIEFLCGRRAQAAFRLLRDELDATIRQLSVGPNEVAAAVERLQTALKDQRRTLKAMATKLVAQEAISMDGRASRVGKVALVAEAVEGFDANDLKGLAAAIVATSGRVAVLVGTGDGRLMVIGRSSDVAVDASALLRGLTVQFGGKGGGRADFAQGGGLGAAADTILAQARSSLARMLDASDGV